ncbi:hypothetical protein, partial [Scrofimicrobium canadense]|uniref:hypothetical protein n=1 Tax=Scrofimicrobium canadense TaxID=2652290 RepID=UPI00197D145F
MPEKSGGCRQAIRNHLNSYRFILFFTYTLVARSFEISVLVISMEIRAALDLWVTQGFYAIFF